MPRTICPGRIPCVVHARRRPPRRRRFPSVCHQRLPPPLPGGRRGHSGGVRSEPSAHADHSALGRYREGCLGRYPPLRRPRGRIHRLRREPQRPPLSPVQGHSASRAEPRPGVTLIQRATWAPPGGAWIRPGPRLQRISSTSPKQLRVVFPVSSESEKRTIETTGGADSPKTVW